ncbi:MAG TPA: ATP-binding protein [Vicinamibacterales bacterium]|nr:ATP-binding protein [Vicinamibacterales bacterium]
MATALSLMHSATTSPAAAADDRQTLTARLVIATVIAAGALTLVSRWPTAFPDAGLTILLLVASVLLSLMKLSLPLVRGDATISMAYAIDFAALLLCGADVAMMIAMFAVVVQCSFRLQTPQPLIRTLYSVASTAIAVQASGAVWRFLSGDLGPLGVMTTIAPMLVTAMAHFVVTSVLIALAIGVTTGKSPARIWHSDFLWSAPSCFVSAIAGTLIALVVSHGTYAMLGLALVPLYVAQRAYRTSIERIISERQHANTLAAMVQTTQQALDRATASEAALNIEKERLAITLKTISEAVITVDSQDRVLLVNDSATRMVAGAVAGGSQPLTSLIADIGVPPAQYQEAIDRLRQTGEPVQARWQLTGPIRFLDVTGTPMRDANQELTGAVWVLRDVTDATQMEYERSKTARLESLGVLAGGLAHDFNNILTSVVGNLSIAQTLVGRDDQRLLQKLCNAEAACVRARGVTAQLLTFAKGGAPVKTAASIEELVVECTRFALSGSPVAAKFVAEPDLWNVQVDTVQISQVVQNLVLNAAQAMPAGGTIDIAFRNVRMPDDAADGPMLPAGIYVCVSFRDYGSGIRADQLCHIFEPYYTTKQKGSGLGLAISSSIVRAHGGSITVESSSGDGTRFDVYLPATHVPVSNAVSSNVQPLVPHNGRVLLMDDDVGVGEVAADMLADLGYDTVAATSGQAAIDYMAAAEAAGAPFDVVILDLTVPGGMGGKETVPHIRALNADLPVLVTSGYADNGVLSDYARHGFDGVLPKPFSIPDLRIAIEQASVRRRRRLLTRVN